MSTQPELIRPTAVERIAELAREAGQPFDIGGTPYVLVPQGSQLVAKPQHRFQPERIEQTLSLIHISEPTRPY